MGDAGVEDVTTPTRKNLYYLGPEGSFTHQAAMRAGQAEGLPSSCQFRLVPVPDAAQIIERVQSHDGWGMIAWDNNIEGFVVPNLDGLIEAADAVGVARVGIDVTFQAFTVPGAVSGVECRRAEHDEHASPRHRVAAIGAVADNADGGTGSPDGMDGAADGVDGDSGDLISGWQVRAHPHGLAQCRRFISRHRLSASPAASNAAACRDLKIRQVALGPALCAELYGLDTIATRVEDFPGARTDFLLIAPREQAAAVATHMADSVMSGFETIVAMVPLSTGAGVLANLLDVLRDAGLNMTSFISRPIKGHDGTYSFVATIDAAPWQPKLRRALETMIRRGDWIKTLAVYPRGETPDPPVDTWMLPAGGVHISNQSSVGQPRVRSDNRDGGPCHEGRSCEDMMRRELLW